MLAFAYLQQGQRIHAIQQDLKIPYVDYYQTTIVSKQKLSDSLVILHKQPEPRLVKILQAQTI